MPRPVNPNVAHAAALAARGFTQHALEHALTAAAEESKACLRPHHDDAAALLEALQAAVEQLEAVALLVADGMDESAGPDVEVDTNRGTT
jgi:hypothetical protein